MDIDYLDTLDPRTSPKRNGNAQPSRNLSQTFHPKPKPKPKAHFFIDFLDASSHHNFLFLNLELFTL
jgi:hypothetical protein